MVLCTDLPPVATALVYPAFSADIGHSPRGRFVMNAGGIVREEDVRGKYVQGGMSYTREIDAEINGFRAGNDSEMTGGGCRARARNRI